MTTQFEDSAGEVRLSGTLLAPGATVGDVLTVQADGSLVPAAGGGSQPVWEAVTVPTDLASWSGLSDPTGNWDFTDGVITFANEGEGSTPVIMTTLDNFGQAWAVETDLMVPDVSSYQTGFNAAAWLDNAESGQELNGAGFQVNHGSGIYTAVFGNAIAACDTAIPDTSWHTYRAVILPLVQQIYFDGVLVGQTFQPPTAAQPDGLKESRFLLFENILQVGTAYRNLKAWRIPMPTFP